MIDLPFVRRSFAAMMTASLIASSSSVAVAAPKGAPKPTAKKAPGKKDKGADKSSHPDASEPADAKKRLAAEKKKEGDLAMQEKRFAEALAAYDAAYEASPDAALIYNRARAEEHAEHFPEALALIEEFAEKAPPELRAKVPKLDELTRSIRARVALLTVQIELPGAAVRLRGLSLGASPLPPVLRVPTGPVTLEVTREGYQPFTRDLSLVGGEPTTVKVSLVPVAKPTVLVVRSAIAGSLVRLDGDVAGAPPVERTVTPGHHAIEVSKEGYQSARLQLSLTEGSRREISLDPTAEKALTSRWWFWTGIGVGVVGGVALTAALLTEKDAGKGTIAPGRVSAGLSF